MFIELQHKYPLKNLINQTRMQNVKGIELSKIHYEFGKFLGLEILAQQQVIDKTTTNAQGNKEKLEFYSDDNFVIVGILRGGLYIAEGLRGVFASSEYVLCKNPTDSLKDISNKNVILTDCVINSGKTILSFLTYLTNNKIYIATNVIYKPTANKILENPNISIFAIRSSNNSYIGQGLNDTGNRLFNTL